jgi:hypothetical protein
MDNTERPEPISRRDAIGLFAATPALGANAALTRAFGGVALTGASIFGADAAAARAGASPDLSRLTVEHFEALVGDTFTIGDTTMTLRDVRRGPDASFRQQFAMIFDAPPEVSIASGLVPVSHPATGRHDLFVTVDDKAGRKALEICFS